MTERGVSVFVSATTDDLGSARLAVRDVLSKAHIRAMVQESLTVDPLALEDYLRAEIAAHDVVICLVGFLHGYDGDTGDPAARSYTQREYDMAVELGKPVFVFRTTEQFEPDKEVEESETKRAKQQAHRDRLLENRKCHDFGSLEELRLALTDVIAKLRELAGQYAFRYLHPPAPPAYFVGRDDEQAQLAEALYRRTPAVIVVWGMGGQGKTTLVARVLRENEGLPISTGLWCTAYRGGYALDSFLDDALAHLSGASFDKRELPDTQARCAELVRLAQERPVLLVIDGVERWLRGWEASSSDRRRFDTVEERRGRHPGLDDFLREMSGLHNGSHLLLTTRAVPAALDGVACEVVPVYEEGRESIGLRGLDPAAAVALLREKGVRGTDEELRVAAEGFGFHPLALEVLAELLARRHGGDPAALPDVSALQPERALHALLEEGRRNLPGGRADERFLRAAAHCHAAPTLASVAAALQSSDDPRDRAITLSDWKLLGFDPAQDRLSIHPLVQEYYRGLSGKRESRAFHRRLSAWHAAQPLPGDARDLSEVKHRILAVEHARSAGDDARCVQLVLAEVARGRPLADWCAAWGHLDFGIGLLSQVADRARPDDRVTLLISCASLRRQAGDLAGARDMLDEVIARLSKGGRGGRARKEHLAMALTNRGNVHWQASRLDASIEDHERALALLEPLAKDDPAMAVLRAGALMNLAIARRECGRFTQADEKFGESIEALRRLAELPAEEPRLLLANALANRGNVLADLVRNEEALAAYAESAGILDALIAGGRGDLRARRAELRVQRAAALSDLERREEALSELTEAHALLRELIEQGRGDLTSSLALCWLGRSNVHLELEQWDPARDAADEAFGLYDGLVEDGRAELGGWRAYALVNRGEAGHGRQDEGHAEDLRRGFEILQDEIEAGAPEMRVALLKLSVRVSARLRADTPGSALALLERAVAEARTGIRDGHAVEALEIEARRAAGKIEAVDWPAAWTERVTDLVATLRGPRGT